VVLNDGAIVDQELKASVTCDRRMKAPYDHATSLALVFTAHQRSNLYPLSFVRCHCRHSYCLVRGAGSSSNQLQSNSTTSPSGLNKVSHGCHGILLPVIAITK